MNLFSIYDLALNPEEVRKLKDSGVIRSPMPTKRSQCAPLTKSEFASLRKRGVITGVKPSLTSSEIDALVRHRERLELVGEV